MWPSSLFPVFQSYGNHTLEQIQYTPDGRGISIGPGFYAIPGIKNIPREMNVSLLKDSENPFSQAVYSSKVRADLSNFRVIKGDSNGDMGNFDAYSTSIKPYMGG